MKFKFDTIAKYYNFLEILAFGKILYGTRLYFLTRTSNPNNILLVGEVELKEKCGIMRNVDKGQE